MSKILVHVPHSSTYIPDYIREGIVLSDAELTTELQIMTDLHTDTLFTGVDTLKCNFSRLVCDVERFENDLDESMSKLGMGAVYTKTSTGVKLRDCTTDQRNHIIETYYIPHHKLFEGSVEKKLTDYGECVIIDCHSFNEEASYLKATNSADICIGTDDYHTPHDLEKEVADIFISHGYTVSINEPFAGSIVPLKHYTRDKRVKTIMLEINRKLYMNELGVVKEQDLKSISDVCNELILLLN